MLEEAAGADFIGMVAIHHYLKTVKYANVCLRAINTCSWQSQERQAPVLGLEGGICAMPVWKLRPCLRRGCSRLWRQEEGWTQTWKMAPSCPVASRCPWTPGRGSQLPHVLLQSWRSETCVLLVLVPANSDMFRLFLSLLSPSVSLRSSKYNFKNFKKVLSNFLPSWDLF